ncbi:MAG: ABC transporter substrate-binding protein [Methanosarcinaceae archaeon]|nr:ABC transporter substrate-binding protein [Methanosarcinaceae archaeon]
MKKSFSLLSVFVIVALLVCAISLSGCIGENDNKSVKNIAFGYQPSTHQMAYMTADAKGWWLEGLKAHGVETVSDNSFGSGPNEMSSLAADAIQVAYVGSAPVITSIASGTDVKIVAAVQSDGSSLLVSNNFTYNSPQDLKGKSIGTFPPGSIQDTLIRDWLKSNNLDPTKDVSLKPMNQGDAITALKSNSVEAVFLPHPAPVVIEKGGFGRTVLTSGLIQNNHPCCVVAVSQKLIDEHPEIVKEIVRIHIKATDYVNNNKEEAAKDYAKKTGDELSVVLASINDWDGMWLSDPHVIKDGVVEFSTSQYNNGMIQRKLTEDEIFDFTFYDEIMKE